MRDYKKTWIWFFFFFAFTKPCLAQTTECDQILMTEMDSLSNELLIHAPKNIIASQDGGKTGFTVYGAYT
jgi:hypothetical protein